ncbi:MULTISPECIES: high-potential iron-sulfur protein [unclassified Variovorax]|uniref:high-potential iron-sulfur protein n=1 Tax=unclassified Variovorax TaxID=663243 RepID=UPI0013182832|nr:MULTISPECIES: high-potential iron-sulfur protein [unclassified Variovorax]VTU14605.1 High-potential iron-sulfur protein [Variovorax sp. SRS16]VTU21281.1 High-potential iron-sulfur protein [Variovorax sp. PBL-E5]
MSNPSRRAFVMSVVTGGAALTAATQVAAQAAVPVAESDPQAVALGYKADTTKVDKAKFPKHEASQMCSGCQLFQGKPADASGPCTLFGGKLVAGKGWCSAWVKKA